MPPKIKRPGEAVRSRERHRSAWPFGIAAVALAAIAVVVWVDSKPTPMNAASSGEAPPPAGQSHPGARELLDGLVPGDSIAGWRVHVMRLVDRQLGVDLLLGDKVLTIWIAKKGSRPAAPPRETERYSIYYGFPAAAQTEVSRDIEQILNDVERRIRKTELTAPAPAGM